MHFSLSMWCDGHHEQIWLSCNRSCLEYAANIGIDRYFFGIIHQASCWWCSNQLCYYAVVRAVRWYSSVCAQAIFTIVSHMKNHARVNMVHPIMPLCDRMIVFIPPVWATFILWLVRLLRAPRYQKCHRHTIQDPSSTSPWNFLVVLSTLSGVLAICDDCCRCMPIHSGIWYGVNLLWSNGIYGS